MYESKNNYGLSGAGITIIRNYLGRENKDFPMRISAQTALKAFRGTGSFDSPDVDILKGIVQEFGKDTILALNYPEDGK